MSKDWTGDRTSTFVTLGASNHSRHARAEHDYYATDPRAVEELLKVERFDSNIWEPACGEGHISETLRLNGHRVFSTDLVDRGYKNQASLLDFLALPEGARFDGDIITNPPYKFAAEFVEKALECVGEGQKVAMFLKIQFLEGAKRGPLLDRCPPYRVWVARKRLKCAINGDFDEIGSSATCYAWFVWVKGYKGPPTIGFINK